MTDPNDAIGLALAGDISPHVALARLLLGGADAAAIRAAIAARRPGAPSERWQALSDAASGRDGELARLAREIAATGSNHAGFSAAADEAIDRVAAFFDRAVAFSPEASVALYSLGDPSILAAGTAEIVDWLTAAGLIAPDRDVVDIGCGIGRVAAALAPLCRSVLALDVSHGMVTEARKRCAAWPNVRCAIASGRDLSTLAASSCDLVLAVDSFPYVVQAGAAVVAAHLAGARRALREGGSVAILNLSYRGDRDADAADIRQWCATFGYAPVIVGERPFKVWDGTAFVMRAA